MKRRALRAAPLILGLIVTAASAQTPTVIDGNRLRIGGTTYRLWAMDAPDPEQRCRHDWPAGVQAARALADLLKRGEVTCESEGRNQEGETVAVCEAGGNDIGASMVRSGMAWSDLAVSKRYVVEEARASHDLLGVHAHACRTAWTWRARNRVEPQFRRQEGDGR